MTVRHPLLLALVLAQSVACSQKSGSEAFPDGEKWDQVDDSGLAFDGADLQCFDGDIEIGIFADGGFAEESAYGMGEINFAASNSIAIRVPGDRTHVFATNTVFTTDGAGNDTAQVLYLDRNEIVPVVHLFYDHEVGHLDGYYSLPKYVSAGSQELIEGFHDPVRVDQAMNCYDYTFGDL